MRDYREPDILVTLGVADRASGDVFPPIWDVEAPLRRAVQLRREALEQELSRLRRLQH